MTVLAALALLGACPAVATAVPAAQTAAQTAAPTAAPAGRAAPPAVVRPCVLNPAPTCASLNPNVALDVITRGNQPACTYSWTVNWGDGAVNKGIVVRDPPAGAHRLATHAYQAQSAYTIHVTGTATGGCAAAPVTDRFTLLGYAALGDSYSAGVGAGDFIDINGAGALCSRSYAAYPFTVAGDLGERKIAGGDLSVDNGQFQFVSCADATIGAFTSSQVVQAKPRETVPPQLDVLQETAGNIGLVTFNIGGNDADFVPVITYCAQRTSKQKSCEAMFGATVGADLKQIKKHLPSLFNKVKTMKGLAPGARVLVLGYPLFFDPAWFQPGGKPQTCSTGDILLKPVPTFENSDMKWIDSAIRTLDVELSAAVKATGFTYVNDLEAFAGGHYLCEQKPYLNAAMYPVGESFHPTAAGNAVLAADVAKTLGLG